MLNLLKEFTDGDTVIICNTNEEINDFLSCCNMEGLNWIDGNMITPIKADKANLMYAYDMEESTNSICNEGLAMASDDYCEHVSPLHFVEWRRYA